MDSEIQPMILNISKLDTPIGQMVAIADQSGLYLLQFADYPKLQHNIAKLKQKTKADIISGRNDLINLVQQELQQYFEGTLKQFTVPLHYIGSDFQKNVWNKLQNISYGQTCSYEQLAISIQNPSACRAVALANATNQHWIIIPCHRVINKNGNIGGYAGGVDRKKWLIHHEQ